ncbi:hypothetical protein RhiirA1_465162 [Rhizophagus irregularis]|uniref:Uncharacterized protein n=1 Tax=Rhizophagus irregularis TaxID=588596 RepID=A0A2N0RGK1_9GLOM|nr:hypothetical protein RhiirA1_465162 [Rhizophagus irregularis]
MIRRRSINQIMGSEKIANQLSSKSSLTSLLLINQEEDSTITSLEENLINKDILISPKNEEISVITPFEEDSTTIPLNEKDNSTTPEYNENEYIFLPRSHTRSYANRPQIMLEHSETEDLSNSDYKQHTDTSSSSDGNESDEELLPILLKIIHRQILNHIKRKKK